MGRLFLRLYILMAIPLVIFFIGIDYINPLLYGPLKESYTDLSKGTFYLIEKRFNSVPRDQWQDLIDMLNAAGGYRIRLKNLQEFRLSDDAIKEIYENKMAAVFTSTDEFYGYKLVANSDLILEIPFHLSDYEENQRLSSSTFELLELELLDLPQHLWKDRLTEINKKFSYPLKLLSLDKLIFSDRLQSDLQAGFVVWHKIDGDEYLYRRIKGSAFAIKIGPFEDPVSVEYVESIVLTCLAIFIAIAVIFWVYPIWRDLNRLTINARVFGQGDFDTRTIVVKHSALSGLIGTFNAMADRIQNLILSHKELTNAASHELRTPIARLRFGMEMIENATDVAGRNRFIKGMNADIDELDSLVAEILTYARFDRDRPQMSFQRHNVALWLEEVVNQAKKNMESISLSYKIESIENKYANFEPRLMARAVGNLLQNARRYASKKIEVVVTIDNANFSIYVDDDGPGIPVQERKSVFDAFKRLDASRDRDTGGFGLGLAIVMRIAQWHDGSVVVTDSPLGGARFTISWPL